MNTPLFSTVRGRANGPALPVAFAALLAALALLLLPGAAFAQADAPAPDPAGIWQQVGAEGPAGSLLVLRADGVAAAVQLSATGDTVQAISGVWQVDGSGTVSVFFDEAVSGTDVVAAGDDTLVLFGGGDLLTALVAPTALYGGGGVAFVRLSAADPGTATPEALTFRSETVPAASSPGRQYTLTLEPGGAATLAADYLNDEPPVVELGAWQAGGLQVTTVFTGTAEADYAEPVTITFSLLGDGTQTLTATEYDEARFGSEGLSLTYVAPGAEAAAAGAAQPVAGIYTSKVLPGASSPGIVLTLALFENGNLLSTSNYLLDEPAITELGTWQADETTVTITLTGQLEREYTEPVTMTWDIAPPDQLTSDAIVLTRLPELTPEEMEAATARLEEEQPSATPGAYMSGRLPAASSPGLIRTLVLYDNGNLHNFSDYLTNDAPPITEFGTWSENAATVTITLTRQLDREYDEPVIETYTKEAGALVQGNVTLNKLAQLMPGEQAEVTGTLGGEMDVPGIFGSGWMAAASSPGLIITLALFDNGAAQQTSNYLIDDGPAVVELGAWEAGAGTVTVTMTAQLDGPYDTPAVETWQTAAPDQLVSGAGIVLTRLEQIMPQTMIEATAQITAAGEVTAAQEVTAAGEAGAAAEVTAATPAPQEEPAAAAGAGANALLPVAFYRSDVLPAAASPGRVIELLVYGDDTILMTTDFQDGRAPVAEIGTWRDSGDGSYTVTLVGQLGRPYRSPVVIVFADQGDSIVATEWDATIYGSEGLTLTAQ